MKDIKNYIHLYNNGDREFYTKNLLAVAHNMIGVLETRDWERLPDKLWSLKDACHKLDATISTPLTLRPLSDIKEDELDGVINYQYFKDHHTEVSYTATNDGISVFYKAYYGKTHSHFWFDKIYSPETVGYLLARQFDLYGLIEAGLAIDKTTLQLQ